MDNAVLERFKSWSAVQGLSQSRAARLCGVSAATLSQVLSGKYAGDTARVAERMTRVLAQAERRARLPKRPEIVLTSVVQDVLEALRTAHDEGVMAVVCGPSGVGKTSAIQLYKQAEPDSIIVTMRPAGRKGINGGSRSLLSRIGEAVGQNITCFGSTWETIEQVGAALKGSSRLVIIDEADYSGEDPLQAIRMVHDIAQVGIVLVTTPVFLQRLRARKSATLNQFLNRVAYSCNVEGLTDEDVEMILESYKLDRTALAAAREGAGGVARRLVNAIVRGQRLAAQSGGKLDARAIARAYAQLVRDTEEA